MRQGILAMMATMAVAGSAPAVGQQPAASCNISAYTIDQDAAGLNVRAGPSGSAAVLRVIGHDISAVAQISGQSGAWFRVSAVSDAESGDTIWRGDGWIHSSLLGLSVANADARLHARPQSRSPSVARLVAEETEVTLIGCSGNWARVRALGRTGWLSPDGQCSNPLTTCA